MKLLFDISLLNDLDFSLSLELEQLCLKIMAIRDKDGKVVNDIISVLSDGKAGNDIIPGWYEDSL